MYVKIKKDQHNIIYYVFYDDNIMCGRCTVEIKKFTAEVKYIKVEEKFRGQGLSLQMWNIVEDNLKNYGINEIIITAYELNEKHGKLVKLYEENGFKISGKEYFKYDGDFLIHSVPMSKTLNILKQYSIHHYPSE